jgi:hypothetical protein
MLYENMNKQKIDIQSWEFTLYEYEYGAWVASFPYEARSGVGSNLKLILTDDEIVNYKNNRDSLRDLSEKIRNKPDDYFSRNTVTRESGYV